MAFVNDRHDSPASGTTPRPEGTHNDTPQVSGVSQSSHAENAAAQPYGSVRLPAAIPVGARIVVRTDDGADERTGRRTYRDFVGHVLSWDGTTLELERDASANGRRPAEHVTIDASSIVRLKPVPERRLPRR